MGDNIIILSLPLLKMRVHDSTQICKGMTIGDCRVALLVREIALTRRRIGTTLQFYQLFSYPRDHFPKHPHNEVLFCSMIVSIRSTEGGKQSITNTPDSLKKAFRIFLNYFVRIGPQKVLTYRGSLTEPRGEVIILVTFGFTG